MPTSSQQPSHEDLIQFLEKSKGLNREDALDEFNSDPDKVKEEFEQAQQPQHGKGPGPLKPPQKPHEQGRDK